MIPTQNDLDPLARFADVEDDRSNPFAGLMAFARDLLAPRQEGIGLAEIDCDGTLLEPLDRPRDEFCLLVLEFGEQAISFGFPDFLNDHLLGGLGSDPAEVGR